MRKKKFVILGILFCMAVICLLSPRPCAAGCPTTAATSEEIFSEFDPATCFFPGCLFDPSQSSMQISLGFDPSQGSMQISLGTDIPTTPLSGEKAPAAICDLPDTFLYLDTGAPAYVWSGDDFDRDGKPDKIIRGSGGFYDDSDIAWVELSSGGRDYDLDGKADKINYNPDGTTWVSLSSDFDQTARGAAMVLGEILSPTDFDRDGKPDKIVRDNYGYGKWVVLSSGGLDHNFDGKPDEYRVGPDGSTYLAEVKIEKVDLSEPAPGVGSVVDHLQPFVLGGPTSETIEYEKVRKKAWDTFDILSQKKVRVKWAEEIAKIAAEKLGKAINDAMDAEPGSEEAKKAAENVEDAAEKAKETAKDAEKAKEELEEAIEKAEKAKKEYREATEKAYDEAEKQNEAAGEAAEKAYKETKAEPAPGVGSVVDHLQPFVLGGPTSETIEYEKAWKKAWEKLEGKYKEAYDKARKAREAEAKSKEAAEKLGQALNNAMDAEPGSDEARKAGEEVSKAAKEAKNATEEAKNAKEEAKKASKEQKKAGDEANEAAKKANESRRKR